MILSISRYVCRTGNYRVTVRLGSKKQAGNTTVRAESRRLFVENLPTKKGES